jgi:hypothetical protein
VRIFMPSEEDRPGGFERIGNDDEDLDGHSLWISRDPAGDGHVAIHLVDWAEAGGSDECGIGEERWPRYQVSVVGVTAELLAAEWREPVLDPPVVGTSEPSRYISDSRRAALAIGQGLGRLIWVREGHDAGRLLCLADDVANRHAPPIAATHPRDGREVAAIQPGALTSCQV